MIKIVMVDDPTPADSNTDDGFNVDFDLTVSPDQKEATVHLKSANPLSSEDLIYVFEEWIGAMKKRIAGADNAVRTDPA